jgi:hypothetical protein
LDPTTRKRRRDVYNPPPGLGRLAVWPSIYTVYTVYGERGRVREKGKKVGR